MRADRLRCSLDPTARSSIGARATLLGITVGLTLACGGGAPEPVTIEIGAHRIAIIIPNGWQYYDHGREHRLETADGDIVFTDFGPVAVEGFAAVLLEARELALRGQRDDAKQVLRELAAGMFAGNSDLQSTLDLCLDSLSDERASTAMETSFAGALDQLNRVPDPDLTVLARRALVDLDPGLRRDIEREEGLRFDGREGRRIVTWHRLTHDFRRWHVFVVNRGNLLVIRTTVGPDAVLGPAFDTVVRSLVFVGPEAY